MRRLFKIPVVLLFAFVPTFIYGQAISLEYCKQRVRQNHPIGPNATITDSIACLKGKNLKNEWLPQLNLNGQATYQSDAIKLDMLLPDTFQKPIGFSKKTIETDRDQYKVWLDATQLIYDGGLNKARREFSDLSYKSDVFSAKSDINKVLDQTTQLYYSIILNRSNKKLVEVLINTYDTKLKQINSLISQGMMMESDRDNITVEVLKLNQQLFELDMLYKSLLANLSVLMGEQIGDSAKFDIPVINKPDSLQMSRPDLAALDAKQEALQYSEKIYKAQRMPKLSAFAQAGYGKPGLNMLSTSFDPYYIIGLNFKWNIFDWNNSARERSIARMQAVMINNQRSAVENNIQISINNSKSRIVQLENAVVTDAKIVELRSSIARRSADRLDKGLISSTDFINDLNAEMQAKLNLEMHKVQLMQEQSNLQSIYGVY
ncbi:MAG TPA: TolC family protein [Bacteroidales bacterium]|mgnify:CR=1 FL=1|nr:TolC family protein [Bacteroidales bacterium]